MLLSRRSVERFLSIPSDLALRNNVYSVSSHCRLLLSESECVHDECAAVIHKYQWPSWRMRAIYFSAPVCFFRARFGTTDT